MHNISGNSSNNGNQTLADRLHSLNTDGPDADGQTPLGSGTDINPADDPSARPRPSPHPDSQPTSTERLAQAPTASERLASSPTTTDALSDQNDPINLSALTGPAAMLARREFSKVPFDPSQAYQAYSTLGADDFAGPDDMRLQQLSNSLDSANQDLQTQLREALPTDVEVTGRAKTPFSTFGKLREGSDVESAPTTIGDIKDLSGARVDVPPANPGFADLYRAQDTLNEVLGSDLRLKQDYIQKPNSWGYTGRVHSLLSESSGLTHEIQVGTPDITSFIDGNLTTPGGDRIALHDVTGYKGEIYGTSIPDDLQSQYSQQLSQITETNRAGQTVADAPAVQSRVNAYVDAVEATLPDQLATPPAAELSSRARMGNAIGRGLGPLDIVGGGFQAANGVQSFRTGGDRIEGAADIAAGSTSIVSGVAITTGRVALGTTTGGVVATLDGAKDIYTGIRDGDVEQTVVGTVKAGAGTAMLAGVATANPVLIAGGAITYGGAVVYESRDAIASAAKSAWNWLTGG